jgi:hypothetical protein
MAAGDYVSVLERLLRDCTTAKHTPSGVMAVRRKSYMTETAARSGTSTARALRELAPDASGELKYRAFDNSIEEPAIIQFLDGLFFCRQEQPSKSSN